METGLGAFSSLFAPWQSGVGPEHGDKYHAQQRDTTEVQEEWGARPGRRPMRVGKGQVTQESRGVETQREGGSTNV